MSQMMREFNHWVDEYRKDKLPMRPIPKDRPDEPGASVFSRGSELDTTRTQTFLALFTEARNQNTYAALMALITVLTEVTKKNIPLVDLIDKDDIFILRALSIEIPEDYVNDSHLRSGLTQI